VSGLLEDLLEPALQPARLQLVGCSW
jgi:hypothetical protein